MKVDYDSEGNAMSIDLVDVERWDRCEIVTDQVNVAITNDRPVNVELLYPDLGLEGPLRVAAERFDLDAEALIAAAQAAIAVPDRPVTMEIGARIVS